MNGTLGPLFVLSFKKRFVVPISLGLGLAYRIDDIVDVDYHAPKRQTIRADGKRRPPVVGQTLRLFTAMRTKHCRKIADVRCTAVGRITIWFSKWKYPPHQPSITIMLRGGKILGPRQLQAFAQRDGFRDAIDMAEFWLAEHKNKAGKFTGQLIEWESLESLSSPPPKNGALQCSPKPQRRKPSRKRA